MHFASSSERLVPANLSTAAVQDVLIALSLLTNEHEPNREAFGEQAGRYPGIEVSASFRRRLHLEDRRSSPLTTPPPRLIGLQSEASSKRSRDLYPKPITSHQPQGPLMRMIHHDS